MGRHFASRADFMSLIAVAAVLLFAQTEVPAPTYREADLTRLEGCVFGRGSVTDCGDFSADVEVLESCLTRTSLAGGEEVFVDAWRECHDGPCEFEKAQPGQFGLHMRNCSARRVAASKIIAARWRAQFVAGLSAEDRTRQAQADKAFWELLESRAVSEDPADVNATWASALRYYLMALRIEHLTGKAGF
jgi:hypothetical protein